jgi:hypothetical protein
MNEQIMFDLVNRIADNDKVAPFQNGFVVLSNEEMVRYTELILQDVMNLFGDEILSLHYLEQECCKDSVYLLKSKIQEHFGI